MSVSLDMFNPSKIELDETQHLSLTIVIVPYCDNDYGYICNNNIRALPIFIC